MEIFILAGMGLESWNAGRFFLRSHWVYSNGFEEISTDCYRPDVAGYSGIIIQGSQGGSQVLGIVAGTYLKQIDADRAVQITRGSVNYSNDCNTNLNSPGSSRHRWNCPQFSRGMRG